MLSGNRLQAVLSFNTEFILKRAERYNRIHSYITLWYERIQFKQPVMIYEMKVEETL